jgi:SAM-dependent methyltransferase
MTATLDHLHRLYAHTDDPWNFAGSDYEQAKFIATRNALTRGHYDAALELGCGNGALARHLAPLCARYTGIDAIERAVIVARKAVPEARFIHDCYPCRLPDDGFDLVILSEVLYFLTPDEIAQLARALTEAAPRAEILCITWLGDTEQTLQGVESLNLFRQANKTHLELTPVVDTGTYRIDRGVLNGDA